MISYIVSSFEKPVALLGCLASLELQTFPKEILVADNTRDAGFKNMITRICRMFPSVTYFDTSDINGGNSCYDSAEEVSKSASGDWICFPSEDCYYVPHFGEFMVRALMETKSQLAYCDMLYDPRWNCFTYQHVVGLPQVRYIDKASFVLAREAFKGFPPHLHDYRDWALVQKLILGRITHCRVPQILMVHN